MHLLTPQLQAGPQVGGNRGHNGPWALPGHQGRKQPGDQRPGGGGVSDPEKPENWQGAGYLMAACTAGTACGHGAEREGGSLRGGPVGRGLLRTSGVWRRPRGQDTQLTAASLPWRRERQTETETGRGTERDRGCVPRSLQSTPELCLRALIPLGPGRRSGACLILRHIIESIPPGGHRLETDSYAWPERDHLNLF